jgi:hypothetical protein
MKDLCTATVVDYKTGKRRACLNLGVVAVTELDGSREVYCVGHNKLREEFLKQAQIDQARWNAVLHYAPEAADAS